MAIRRHGDALSNSSVRRRFRWAMLGLLCCVSALGLRPPLVTAQRPTLRPASRDHFAGKLVLLPRDAQPASLQLPRTLAQVADYDLVTPPFNLLNEASRNADDERLFNWLKQVDYADADGLIVALDALAGGANVSAQVAQRRLDALKAIRARRPDMPIFGFITLDAAAEITPLHRAAFDLVTAGALDRVLVGVETGKAAPVQWQQELQQRRLQTHIELTDAPALAAVTLLARQLNLRFGLTPKILPIFSAKTPPAEPNAAHEESIGRRIAALGGVKATIKPDILLFVHLPQTAAPARATFVESMAGAIDSGFRVALADVSPNKESKEALLGELRRRKLLDRLTAYASSDPAQNDEAETSARALAHAAVWLVSIKFLRDDLERLRRTERAQVGLLLSGYLHDWAYVFNVYPKVEALARRLGAQPPETVIDRLETFASDELKPIAAALFNDQFKRNIHATLMHTGERAQFELSLLQRVQFHLASVRPRDAEIGTAVHLVFIGFLPPPTHSASMPRAEWELLNEKLPDERLARRFEAINWRGFKTDAPLVELTIKLNPPPNAPHPTAAQGYTIRSRRAGETRRIEITAPAPQGAYYALGKLELLGADDLLAQDVNLSETPLLAERGIIDAGAWTPRTRREMMSFLGRVRMNRYYYAPANDPLRRARWRESYSQTEQQRFRDLIRAAEEHFVQLVYVLSPAGFNYAGEADFIALTRKLRELAALGVRRFLLSFADVPAKDAAALAAPLKRVHEWLQIVLPGVELSVAPPGNMLPAEVSAAWPKDLPFLLTSGWAAPLGRRLIIHDLFPANGGEEGRLNLAAKLGVPTNFAPDVAGYVATPMNQARAALLPLATAAEYAWDAGGYEAGRAFNRALNLLYDESSRAGVRTWAQVLSDPATLNQRLAALPPALEQITATRERGLLRGELAQALRVLGRTN